MIAMSPVRPETGRGNFQGVSIRVSEVKACAPSRPMQSAFECNIVVGQMFLPCGQFAERDRERQMQRAPAMMRRDHPPWTWCRSIGHAVAEQQQHLLAGDLHRAHALVLKERREAEETF